VHDGLHRPAYGDADDSGLLVNPAVRFKQPLIPVRLPPVFSLEAVDLLEAWLGRQSASFLGREREGARLTFPCLRLPIVEWPPCHKEGKCHGRNQHAHGQQQTTEMYVLAFVPQGGLHRSVIDMRRTHGTASGRYSAW